MSINSKVSYKVDICIEPKWDKILKWAYPILAEKSMDEIESYIQEKASLISDNCSPLYKIDSFRFTEIFDALSGLRLVWSENEKKFVEELSAWGFLIGEPKIHAVLNKDLEKTLTNRFAISTYGFGFEGFHGSLTPLYVPKENIVTIFPYYQIVAFFIETQQCLVATETTFGSFPNMKIEKFSSELGKLFLKHEIKYSACSDNPQQQAFGTEGRKEVRLLNGESVVLSGSRVQMHNFENQFYFISLNVKLFEPGNFIDHRPSWAAEMILN